MPREVERDLGITVSIGLSANKFLAKIASDMDKPRGFAVLGQAEAAAFLAPKPVGFIYGVGAVSAAKLAADGYRLIADLQRADEHDLMRRYGEEGARLWRLARGIDARAVDPERDTKSISAETTFERDIGEFRPLEQHSMGSDGESVGAAEGQCACRLDRDAEAQERRFQDPHAGALARAPDPARRAHLRRRPRPAQPMKWARPGSA